MYCDKENINILTSLFAAHSVRCAVVCPGSRNAAIAHNLHEAGLECHPVTDERSAAFYALGLSLARREPVAVCVTSGSAVLNTIPAIAEAYYRHVPLVVISADRPAWAIGQLQGQTLPQPGVFSAFVGCCVDLPEVHDDASRAYCARLANEALCEMMRHHPKPVHINVPISEPLFRFNTPTLPAVNKITVYEPHICACAKSIVHDSLSAAHRPMTVIGQCAADSILPEQVSELSAYMPVLFEPLGVGADGGFIDDALSMIADDDYAPDLIIYIGDTVVSNKLRKFLSKASDARAIVVNPDGGVHDVFGNLSAVIDDDIRHFVTALCDEARDNASSSAMAFRDQWLHVINKARGACNCDDMPYSEKYVVRAFEEKMGDARDAAVHYANSSAVRYAASNARHYVYVNRGTNGIEGSLSTAAGFSLGTDKNTFCVIGDLSFFYDCNALWNMEIGNNLRILLLNNGVGKIFETLPGLSESKAFPTIVAGAHIASAKGVCESFGVEYRSVAGKEYVNEALDWLMQAQSSRPMLLECLF